MTNEEKIMKYKIAGALIELLSIKVNKCLDELDEMERQEKVTTN